jgi:hypothetical protein
MRRQRLAEGRDGGREDLRWLVAQPAVNGADLGRLNHSRLQPAAGGDVQIEVEFVEPRRRPAGFGEKLGYAPRIGEGEHSGAFGTAFGRGGRWRATAFIGTCIHGFSSSCRQHANDIRAPVLAARRM